MPSAPMYPTILSLQQVEKEISRNSPVDCGESQEKADGADSSGSWDKVKQRGSGRDMDSHLCLIRTH